MDQWRDREKATDLDCFQVGLKYKRYYQTPDHLFLWWPTANKQAISKVGHPTLEKCGFRHYYATTHSWSECANNSSNKDKREEILSKVRNSKSLLIMPAKVNWAIWRPS